MEKVEALEDLAAPRLEHLHVQLLQPAQVASVSREI